MNNHEFIICHPFPIPNNFTKNYSFLLYLRIILNFERFIVSEENTYIIKIHIYKIKR